MTKNMITWIVIWPCLVLVILFATAKLSQPPVVVKTDLYGKVPYSTALPNNLYVKVPYSTAFDEVIEELIVKGDIALPEKDWLRIKDGEVQMQITKSKKWIHSNILLADHLIPGCKYDGKGNYFVLLKIYRKCEGFLIHKHRGRLELFADSDLLVWDVDDKTWRFPTTLGRVPKDWKLKSGERLWDVQIDPSGSTGTLDDILKRYEKNL